MVSNQTEFNEKYSKEIKEIKLKNKDFSGSLVVENYSELEKLYLRRTGKVDRIVLQNLNKLLECTIWECGTEKLVIENCPQIRKLNVRSNLLTNLEFLKSLENLEELEIDHNTEIDSGLEYLPVNFKSFTCENTKLSNILKSYKGNWESYKKDLQELIELANQKPQQLLKNFQILKEENRKLKENQPVTIDFEKKYQKLKGTLHFLTKEEELKSKEIDLLVTDDILENVKDLKEDLLKTQKIKKELGKQLVSFKQFYFTKKQKIEQKEKELEELKKQVITKNETIEEDLEEALENQAELVKNNYSESWKKQLERSKKRLLKQVTEEKVNLFCQLQSEITQLKLEIQKNFNQINQTFHIENLDNLTINQQIKNIQGFNIEGSNHTITNPSVHDNTLETVAYEEETETAIELPPKQLE
jgi:hypothetical protein